MRGDNRADSDIDLLIDIDPETVADIYAYVGLKNYIAELFSDPVDVVTRDALTLCPPVSGERCDICLLINPPIHSAG